uniref:Uncharacterized protein n=1 Tax=Angiostrongylus cantonensis TaxID=6313 RepID=A0A0K0DE09_ANGCA
MYGDFLTYFGMKHWHQLAFKSSHISSGGDDGRGDRDDHDGETYRVICCDDDDDDEVPGDGDDPLGR